MWELMNENGKIGQIKSFSNGVHKVETKHLTSDKFYADLKHIQKLKGHAYFATQNYFNIDFFEDIENLNNQSDLIVLYYSLPLFILKGTCENYMKNENSFYSKNMRIDREYEVIHLMRKIDNLNIE